MPVAVRDLREGDLVKTAHGTMRVRAVQWIGGKVYVHPDGRGSSHDTTLTDWHPDRKVRVRR